MAGGGESTITKLLVGVLASFLASGVGFVFFHEGGVFNPKEAAVLRGAIDSAELSSGNPCCSFAVHVTIEGYNGKTCVLQLTLMELNTGSKELLQGGIEFRPEADHDEAGVEIPVGITVPGNYVMRFILYAPNGVEMAHADTPAFQLS